MNYLTDKPSPLALKDSGALKLSSSLWLLVKKCQVSTKSPTIQSLSAILILEKIFTAISLWVVEPQCSPVFLNVWANKSLLWLLQQWRLRLLHLLRESSWFGLVDQSLVHSQPSRLCGLPDKNIKRLELLSSIENASDYL